MPLTDPDDALWANGKLTGFVIAVDGLASTIDSTEKQSYGVLLPMVEARRLDCRRQVLDREVVSLQIMAKVLPDTPGSLDVDNPNDLRWFSDHARRAMGVIKDLADVEHRLGDPGPRMSAAALHAVVWSAAERLWTDGHHQQAVHAAASAVNSQVQSLLGRRDVADADLMHQAFSVKDPEIGKPRLRWPGDLNDQTVKSMREGLRQFAPGCFLTIRNPPAHETIDITEQEALEQLGALSTLMRWIDKCEVFSAEVE